MSILKAIITFCLLQLIKIVHIIKGLFEYMVSYLKKNLYLFYGAQVLNGLRFIAPVWVLFFTHYISFSQLGILEAIGLLLSVILELPTGVFADLIGRKYSIIIGYVIAGIGYIVIGFGNSFSIFLLGYIVSSFGSSFASGADTAILFDTLKDHDLDSDYTKYSGKSVFLGRGAVIVAMVIGQFMYAIFFGLPYVALGIVTLVAAFLFIFIKEPTREKNSKLSLFTYREGLINGFHEAFKNESTSKLSFYFLCIASVELLLLWFYYAPFLSWLGYSSSNIGYIYATIALTRMGVSLASHKIDNLLGEKNLSVLLPMILGISLLFGFIRNIYMGTIFLIFHYSLFTLRYTALDKYINLRFDSKYRASAISTLNMFVSFIYACVILIATKFISLNNTGIMLSIFGGVLLFIGIPLAVSFVKSTDNKVEDFSAELMSEV